MSTFVWSPYRKGDAPLASLRGILYPRMVEAATVVFGRYVGTEAGRDGRTCLENWLKTYCLDYRLHNDNGT